MKYMNIKLVKLTKEYKTQLFEMLDEWTADIKNNNGNNSPWAIFKNDYHDFDYYLDNLEVKETKDGMVPDSTFFCLDLDRNIFVGAVNIRHYLNEGLLKTGGHIGDGIRPSERRKGYASAMIDLALDECKKLGIDKVLMCCDKDNIGSAKSIINNGGILENEIEEDGVIEQRYWIDISNRISDNLIDNVTGGVEPEEFDWQTKGYTTPIKENEEGNIEEEFEKFISLEQQITGKTRQEIIEYLKSIYWK